MISNSDLYKINTDRDEQIKEVMQSKVLADIKIQRLQSQIEEMTVEY